MNNLYRDKISAMDTPNQILIKNKKLSYFVYDTFKHFLKTKEYDNGWLLLILVNKGVKEKHELRDFNSQLKC